jgi:hypothetical protein
MPDEIFYEGVGSYCELRSAKNGEDSEGHTKLRIEQLVES